jgi:hypothetical protein
MATVKNDGSEQLRLLQVGNLYNNLPHVNLVLEPGDEGTVPDSFLDTPEGKAVQLSGDLVVLAYDPDDAVIAAELGGGVSTVYKLTQEAVGGDPISNDNDPATETSANAENYDFSNPSDRNLVVTVNGVDIPHTFEAGDFASISAATAEEVDASLAANAALVAEVDVSNNTTNVILTTKKRGTTATLDFSGNAATVLGFSGGQTGAIAPATLELVAKDSAGNPAPGVEVELNIFTDASTVPGTPLANTQFQAASKGSFSSGEYTNSAVGVTDENGELDFEVALFLAGNVSAFVDMSPPADNFLAVAVSPREEIVQSAA